MATTAKEAPPALVVMSSELPGFPAVQAATQTIGVLGAKGSGKTFLAHRYVEELTRCGLPFIAFDPIGNWGPSLRRGKDGKSLGLPVVVLGGDEGDAPLPEGCGSELGAYLAERDGAVVLDVSAFSKKKRKTIVADLCEALFHGAKRRRVPRLVAFEESQLFVPQGFERGEERMIGAVTDIVRLGRNYGLGAMLVSQRPQSVHKEVLNQVECLFVGQLRGPQERKAIAGWVTEQGQDLRAQLAELPALSVGEFFCWSPSWLRVFKKVTIAPKSTFDGTRTPDGSEQGKTGPVAPPLAPSDFLNGLQSLLVPAPVEVVARAHRAKIAELAVALPSIEPIDTPFLGDSMMDPRMLGLEPRRQELQRELDALRSQYARLKAHAWECEQWIDRMTSHGAKMQEDVPEVWCEEDTFQEHPAGRDLAFHSPFHSTFHLKGSQRRPDVPARQPSVSRSALSDAKASTEMYGRLLLSVIAAYGPLTRMEITLLSGRSRASTAFISAMNWLLESGFIVAEGPAFVATAAAKNQSVALPMRRGKDVYAFWQKKWNDYDALLFRTLFGYAQGLTRAELSEKSGRSSASTAFIKSVNRLFALGVVEGGGNGQKIAVTATTRKWMT